MLTELTDEHTHAFYQWVSNKEVVKVRLTAFQPHRDIDWVQRFITKIRSDSKSWNQVIVIHGTPIGYCGLSGISQSNRSAEYFILIGDEESWNKGIGTKAGMHVLEYGFIYLNLHRIWLTVSECNPGAICSYEKMGFTKESIMKDACSRDGEFHNKIVMGLFQKEWVNNNWL